MAQYDVLADVGRPDRATDAASFIPVDLRSLQNDADVPFDLYQRLHGVHILYRHRDRPFDAITRARLLGNRIESLWVASGDAPRLGRYFEQHLRSVVGNRTVPAAVRAGVLRSTTVNLASQLLDDPSPEMVARALSVTEHLASFATVEPTAIRQLIRLADTRTGLKVHSANTAVFALTIALADGVEDLGVLATAAVAGLSHDVGLADVSQDILGKPAALSDSERIVVSRHPGSAAKTLRDGGELPDEVCEAVLAHHERTDGSGYPEGLRGAGITRLARIVAVAEVFDALTSHQPWRRRLAPFAAAKMMVTETPGLDPKYVRLLIRALRA